MRLSEVRGDRTLDVIAGIIGPLVAISANEKVMELFERRDVPEGMTKETFFANRLAKAVPSLVRDNKDELIEVMAVLDGVTPDEYRASLSMPKLLQDVYELVTDRELMAFLAPSEQQTE